MSSEWFEDLAPPRGGLQRLRERLEPQRRPTARPILGLVFTMAGLLLWLQQSPPEAAPAQPLGPGIAVLTGFPVDPVTAAPDDVGHTAVMRVPTTNEAVVLYRVASTQVDSTSAEERRR